jgi:spoIIIJ-associated protein
VVVDVEDYRQRRERTLRDVAARAAERVRRTRQTVALEPMPSNERRIVHLTLQGDRFVATHSIGEGDGRKVVISPRGR